MYIMSAFSCNFKHIFPNAHLCFQNFSKSDIVFLCYQHKSQEVLDQYEKTLGLSRSLVGMHVRCESIQSFWSNVRRTDKIGTGVLSAKVLPIARYIGRAQAWWRWSDKHIWSLCRVFCSGQGPTKLKLEERDWFGKNSSSMLLQMIHGWGFSLLPRTDLSNKSVNAEEKPKEEKTFS